MIKKSISHILNIVCTRKLTACRTLRTRKLCVRNEENTAVWFPIMEAEFEEMTMEGTKH